MALSWVVGSWKVFDYRYMNKFYYFTANTPKLFFFGVCKQEEFATTYCEALNELYGIELLDTTAYVQEEEKATEHYLITKADEEVIKVMFQCCAIGFGESTKVNQELDLVFTGQQDAYVYINGKAEDIEEFTEKKRNWKPKPNLGVIQIKIASSYYNR